MLAHQIRERAQNKTNCCVQAWSRLKKRSISKSKIIESKFFWKFWNRYLSNWNNIENIKTLIQNDKNRKITIQYFSIQNKTGVISININLYSFYSIISISYSWKFDIYRNYTGLKNITSIFHPNLEIIPIPNSFKKYREYLPSAISVSDRFFLWYW